MKRYFVFEENSVYSPLEVGMDIYCILEDTYDILLSLFLRVERTLYGTLKSYSKLPDSITDSYMVFTWRMIHRSL